MKSTDIIKVTVFFIFVIFSHSIFAESQQFYGLRPQINITKEISDRWDINVFTSTHPILTDNINGRTRFPTDIQYYFQTSPIYKYSPLLEQKPRALDQAAPLQDWVLPEVFDRLRRVLEVRMERRGRKEYIQILRLLENFSLAQVEQAIKQAMGFGTIGFDAIKHLILCAIEQRPAKLDLMLYPYLPRASVKSTEPRSYLSLLQGFKSSQSTEVRYD